METIYDLSQEISKEYNDNINCCYGSITITKKGNKNIVIKFNDINDRINKLSKEKKETTSGIHKGTKLGKLIETHIKPDETVMLKNINFTKYDTIQCDFLFRGIFKEIYENDIGKP